MFEHETILPNVGFLNNFPYESYSELQEKAISMECSFRINRSIALDLANYDVSARSTFIIILGKIQIILAVIIILFAILSKSILMLLGIPIMLAYTLAFHPSGRRVYPESLFVVLAIFFVSGLLWGFVMSSPWMVVTCIAIAASIAAQELMYSQAVKNCLRLMMDNEQLFCFLWEHHKVEIITKEGKAYTNIRPHY